MPDDDFQKRLLAAARAATRVLSGKRPATLAEQLDALSGTGYDLDRPQDIYGTEIVA